MKRFFCMMAVTVTLCGTTLVVANDSAGVAQVKEDGQPAKGNKAKSGVSINNPKAFQGYTLISPISASKSYLIDMNGNIVRTWEGGTAPAITAYLLPDGNLLRPASGTTGLLAGRNGIFPKGHIQEFNWDGEVVWDFAFQSRKEDIKSQYTHDMIKLPNGNVLAIMTMDKTAAETTAAGRKETGPIGAESLLELRPKGKNEAEIVWEWHVWDHLIQEHDAAKPKYGKVADHPERIDLNFNEVSLNNLFGGKGKGIGGIGGKGGIGGVPAGDWTHFNGLAYNADLDQVMISVHGFSEFWIIDHGTTKAEAAGHKGGKYGKGGDILYRWGNPHAYLTGKTTDQRLFGQHNAHWIPKGLPGAGHVLVFNNGLGRKDGNYSSVDEIVLPVDAKGHYPRKAGTAFGPDKALWSYTAPTKTDFYAMIISGAQRLPNGDTLICSGTNGTVFEVTPDKEIMWKYDASTLTGGGKLGGLAKGVGGFSATMVFRALRFGPNDPALDKKKLTPQKS
jgi:Arylsulfotransferase (ASST)